MWKCKQCSGEVIERRVEISEIRVDFELRRNSVINRNDDSDEPRVFGCCNCSKESSYIEKIAEWED